MGKKSLLVKKKKIRNIRYERIFLVSIVLWPILLIYFFHRTNSAVQTAQTPSFTTLKGSDIGAPKPSISKLRSNLKSIVERFEPVGYGPTKPRAAFVLIAHTTTSSTDTASQIQALKRSIDSVLRTTDRNRIFIICVVFPTGVIPNLEDTTASDVLQAQFDALDGGTSEHWHGGKKHSHQTGQTDHEHPPKVKVLLSAGGGGVAAKRREAGRFLAVLAGVHEKAGMKQKEEEIMTVFLRPGAVFEGDGGWIDTVTEALVTPNVRRNDAISFAFKSANYFGETRSLTLDFKPIDTQATSEELSASNGESYPTPLVQGYITAMRLNTFLKLLVDPKGDDRLMTEYGADVEMSLALWNCGDGIRVIPSLKVGTTDSGGDDSMHDKGGYTLVERDAIRLASVWTSATDTTTKEEEVGNIAMQTNIYNKLAKRYNSNLSDTRQAAQEVRATLPFIDMWKTERRCRSFGWFMDSINKYEEDEFDDTEAAEADDVYREEKLIKQPKAPEQKQEQTKPTKPLRPLNLEIVSRTQPVHLTYVDIKSNSEGDPHLGAVDEAGKPNYLHDAKALRNDPPLFHLDDAKENCDRHDGNWQMLTQRVSVDFAAHAVAEADTKPRAKIFCTVYTIESNHDRIPPILQTWGPRCDGFMVASDKTDPKLHTVNILHEGPEEYGNIWQKVRAIWKYVYDNYYEGYDWFHIGGDDLYVLVENLRLYLESEEIVLAGNGGVTLPTEGQEEGYPLFLGRRFKEQGNEERIFNSGGSGYTINRAALKALVVDAFPTCMPKLKTFAEDVMVAQCLRNKVKVFPYDTKDEGGSERYMPFLPANHLSYKIPADKKDYDWYDTYSIDIKEGIEHCSKKSVAFHYIKPPLMKRMHAILYGHCSK